MGQDALSGGSKDEAPAPGPQGTSPSGLGSLRRNLPQDYARLELAIDATNLGIWEWNVETGSVYWSDRLRSILGVSPDAAADYGLWLSRLHPDDAGHVRAEAHRLTDPASGGKMHLQHRMIRPDGEVRWIESHGQMLYQDGRATRLLGTVTDITARKATEDELVQSLAALEVTLDAADAVPWQYNTLTRDLRWSHRVTELFSFREGERFPTLDDFLAHVHPDDQALLLATREAERVAASGEKFTLQLRLRRGDGSWRWIERRSIVGQDEPGGRWVYGVDIDISARKSANEALRETAWSLARERERLEIALLTGRLGVYEWRVGEDQVWWSPEVYPLYGVDPASFTPTVDAFTALIHPADRAGLWQKTRESIEQKSLFDNEYRILRPDGELRWIANRSRPGLDAHGNVERITGVAADITERKQHEEQVLLLMREVNHRSKNLLAVVQAVAIQSSHGSDPAEFSRRFAARLQGLAASLDLLVLNGWRGVEIGELIRSQLAHFQDAIGKRVALTGPPLLVKAAVAQSLGMALHELATNAGKYGALSTPDGRVDIHWEIGNGPDPSFRMTWQESGGPPVSQPSRRGFGTSVMTTILGRSVDGEAVLDYRAGGLVWTLVAPADRI